MAYPNDERNLDEVFNAAGIQVAELESGDGLIVINLIGYGRQEVLEVLADGLVELPNFSRALGVDTEDMDRRAGNLKSAIVSGDVVRVSLRGEGNDDEYFLDFKRERDKPDRYGVIVIPAMGTTIDDAKSIIAAAAEASLKIDI